MLSSTLCQHDIVASYNVKGLFYVRNNKNITFDLTMLQIVLMK